LIDESTNVTSDKHLFITCRYFSEKDKTIFDDFIGLILVTLATGKELFRVLKQKIETLGLSLNNCIGYGSNRASNVISAHNSVWSRIKEE
jgi:hypothetical protein